MWLNMVGEPLENAISGSAKRILTSSIRPTQHILNVYSESAGAWSLDVCKMKGAGSFAHSRLSFFNVHIQSVAFASDRVKNYAQISLQAPENSVSRRQRCPG